MLIGWSQVSRYEGEPLAAWAEALQATGVPPAAVDSLDVVYCQSWPYDDPPGRLAAAVGATPKRRHYSGIGGTTPLALLAAAARRIARGEADVCAVVGGEALATVRAHKRAGERPPWSHRHPDPGPFPYQAPFHPSEVAHRVFLATTTFAIRDVARRARRAETVDGYRSGIGQLFAPMTAVAARNPHAWFPQERSAAELVTVGEANRMVAYPYTKLVTAMLDVDLAAALVVASGAATDRLGVPAERRVHLWGWGEARDPDHVAEHPDLWRSPAMAAALRGAVGRADVGVDDVAHLELYSCFPSSVSFSLDALGLHPRDTRAPFTVTGGLPYAGGPGSAYGLGATAAMADALVADPGSLGLVTGVGMHLSRHAALVLSTDPGRDAAASAAPLETEPGHGGQPPGAGPDGAGPSVPRPIADVVDGPATIAAYTVHHGRDGAASDALLVCDVAGRADGARCYAVTRDPGTLASLESEEWVGRNVDVRHADGVNVASA